MEQEVKNVKSKNNIAFMYAFLDILNDCH